MHHNLCNNSSETEVDVDQQNPTIDHQLEPPHDYEIPDDSSEKLDEPTTRADLEVRQKHLASKAKVSKNLDFSKPK